MKVYRPPKYYSYIPIYFIFYLLKGDYIDTGNMAAGGMRGAGLPTATVPFWRFLDDGKTDICGLGLEFQDFRDCKGVLWETHERAVVLVVELRSYSSYTIA